MVLVGQVFYGNRIEHLAVVDAAAGRAPRRFSPGKVRLRATSADTLNGEVDRSVALLF